MLCVGPGAVLSHETAAEIHGLTDKPSRRIHISVPAERRPGQHRKIRGVVIHRSRCLVPQWQPPWQLPRTTVEDTVLDLVAAARSFDDAYGWISAAVGRRLATPELLGKALAARSRIRWRAWVTAALQDAADGVHSPLERNYVHGVERAHGLPDGAAAGQAQARQREPLPGQPVRGVRRCASNWTELAAHPAEGRWRDTYRDNANLVQGTVTLRYGWPDATEHRCRTAAEIAAVLRRRGWTGTLRPCGPGCTAAPGRAERQERARLRSERQGLGGAGGVPLGGSLGPRGHFGLRLSGGLRGGGLGHRHQRLEQPGVVAVFRIPLHAQAPAVSLQLDRLLPPDPWSRPR